MAKLRVAILRGGPSYQYDDSLATGSVVLKYMPDHYETHDIFITKDGTWHRDGAPRSPDRALAGIDIVFNSLHGHFGEDGKVQKILEMLRVPYTGSPALASALSMNKLFSKKVATEQGIKTPYYTLVKNTDNFKEKYDYIYQHFYLPFVVKPATGGGSVGTTIVKDFAGLRQALDDAFNYSDTVLVEEFIRGREASVGIVDNFRNHDAYVLFPAERAEFSYKSPGTFSQAEKILVQDAAHKLHKALGLRHYSQTDFIITPRRGIYFLEVNSQPVLHEKGALAASLEAVGSTLTEFIHHVLKLAKDPI